MNIEKKRIVFLTLDPFNPVIKKLLLSLSNKFDLLVVSDFDLGADYPCKHKVYRHKRGIFESFLFLFYKHVNSIQENNFIKRNVYRKNKYVINIMYLLKKFAAFFFNLPSYSDINFFLYKNTDAGNDFLKASDICFVDANLRHTLTLNPLVVKASILTSMVSIVYSWDNPQYSTINKFSKAYLVFNEINKLELNSLHNIDLDKIFITGSLIHDYLIEHGLPKKKTNIDRDSKIANRPLKILYAAVFGSIDDIMIREEIKFLIDLINKLNDKGKDFELIFRPYPSIKNPSLYEPLLNYKNVKIFKHKDFQTIPRLGNKSETISFNKDDSKILQFYDVDVLLSTGSTYTLEFAFSDTPIIHMNANTFLKNNKNSLFFNRLAIYGHLNHLSPEGFNKNVVDNFDALTENIYKLNTLSASGYSDYLRRFSNPFCYEKKQARDLIQEFLIDFSKNQDMKAEY